MPIQSVDDPRWLALVEHDPHATAFHHPAWIRAVASSYRFDPFLVTLEEDDRIVGGLPMMRVPRFFGGYRWVSLPFTDRCEPLGDATHVDRLVDELQAARAKANVDELEVRAPLLMRDSTLTRYVRHVVPLSNDIAAVEKRFAPSVRRAVRQGRASQARVRIGTTEADLAETFYGLHVATRRRLGMPVQPRRFFRHLWHRLGPDLCRTLLLESDGRAIAGVVLLTWKSHLVYKYGASDHHAWKMRPNNVLFQETIEWACANGFTEFDLGRTDSSAASLRRFKRGWGAEEEILEYTSIGKPRALSGAGSKPIVRTTLRHSPEWFVRLTGEVVYRHAA